MTPIESRSSSRRPSIEGPCDSGLCTNGLMSRSPDQDTSLTLMMRVQQDPADPRAWDEFVRRYQPMIRAWCLKWGAQSFDADDVAQHR